MAHVISCNSCGRKSSVSDEIFDRRIAGKKVTLRCTQCREPIPVDGTKPGDLRGIQKPEAPAPPPASARQQPQAKATLLGFAGLPAKPPILEPTTPKPPPPRAFPGPSVRDEMVTVPEGAFEETTRVAPVPVAPRPSPASAVPLELAATVLQTALAPVASPPPRLPSSSAPLQPRAPVPELELTPSAVACPIELPAPASTEGLARDKSSRPRDRRLARVALFSVVPLLGAAALTVAVLAKRGSPPAPSAVSVAPKTATAKLDAPPPKSAPLPAASQELAPLPTAALPDDNTNQPPPDELAIPSYVNAPVVLHRTHLALRRAERCHPQGHAVGTAQVEVTFAPNGRVVDARLEGEPLASAPVSRCLLDHARSIRVPRFKGKPFTIQQPITLR